MPRIDPLSLLKCLSVLLGPTGGIKSKDEVTRLANLMTKFSKKLVSKCIYIQILKSTQPHLLNQFMAAGGWNLIHMWLTDGILAKNWALIQELLELLLLCPVDIERLKSNNCPKLIKGLSKEGSHQGVRLLASRLVEQWLKMVKGEVPVSAVMHASVAPTTNDSSICSNNVQSSVDNQPPSQINKVDQTENVSISSDSYDTQNSTQPLPSSPLKLSTPLNVQSQLVDKFQAPSPNSVRITIRDGKQVLTQVQVDSKNIDMCVDNSPCQINGVIDNEKPALHENDKVDISENESLNQSLQNIPSEVKENSISSDVNDSTGNGDINEKNLTENKSTSDKENRDKKSDKKPGTSDKKSSSSKSSSKHSSSKSSSKHGSSSHKSSSKSSSSSSKDKSSRDKDKRSSKHSSSSTTNKSRSEKEKEKEKERLRKDQEEKDKATLEKVKSSSLSLKMGKIPKKKAEEDKDTATRKLSTDSKDGSRESKTDAKKIAANIAEKKNISISIENRKSSQESGSRPKTVKTFNSKFRSTGLEEEVKPPPPRGTKKSVPTVPDKKILTSKPVKRPSPSKDVPVAEKKPRLSLDAAASAPVEEKKGGIKLIPPKPKPAVLQESDMFMDALMTASTKSKEPRKRKRKNSTSKEPSADSKSAKDTNNENNNEHNSPPSSPISPKGKDKDGEKDSLKPNFKFYQDTLESEEDADKEKSKPDENGQSDEEMDEKKKSRNAGDEDDEGSRTPTPEDESDDNKASDSEDPAAAVSEALKKDAENGLLDKHIGALKSVLVMQKRKGPKKSLKWKTELESIRYFELDETERVNVTKTFTDMKQLEKQNEREAFHMARKLINEDLMEEKIVWRPLIPVDLSPDLVEPGKDSHEKDIQYAREKSVLETIYFTRSMIPDAPAEPDEDRHLIMTDPKIIPLDDLTGNKDSEKDFTAIPWPEPKPQLPAPATIAPTPFLPIYRPNQTQNTMQSSINQLPPHVMNSIPPMVPEIISTAPVNNTAPAGAAGSTGGGGWRTGDGKLVVPDSNPLQAAYPQPMDTSLAPPGMMVAPMYNQEGYMMTPEEMAFGYQPPPPAPGMFPGPPPGGPPFQGARGPMRGRGGPGWFRGGPPHPRGMPWRGGWRGGKQPPVCRQFSKNGYCRVGEKCQYLHPGVNCPPF